MTNLDSSWKEIWVLESVEEPWKPITDLPGATFIFFPRDLLALVSLELVSLILVNIVTKELSQVLNCFY